MGNATRPNTRLRALRSLALLLLAMIGVVVAVLNAAIPDSIIEKTGMSRQTLLIISIFNNALLVSIAVLIGTLTAHKVGLTSLIANQPSEGSRVRAAIARFPIYAIIGVTVGMAISIADSWLWQNIPALNGIATTHDFTANQPSILLRLLYGGVTEEVLLRWGLMSLLVWVIFKLSKNHAMSVGAGIFIAALLFGLGHLPTLYATLNTVPPELIVRVIGLNALLGIVYGTIYARDNLESAMITHAATHIGMLAASLIGIVIPGAGG